MKRRTFQNDGPALPLAEALARFLSLPAPRARALAEAGAVYVAGRRCREPLAPLAPGQSVVVVLEEAGHDVLAPAAPAPPLRILLEDGWVLAVDKPAGLTAQPTAGRVGASLVDLASAHLGRLAGLVHRLDRDTSGVTVFGKTPQATAALAACFREGRAHKRYLAATGPGLPEAGRIELPLSRDPGRPGRFRATRAANGVPALTDFRALHRGPDFSLVELLPRTGRTHQLRAHLAALGLPILGDERYGGASGAAGLSAPRCLLHAQALLLAHPHTRRPLLLEAPLPDELGRFFAAAGVVPPPGAPD